MQKHKTHTTRKDRGDTTAEVKSKDLRDPQVDADTGEVLDDIECCLAEVEDENDAATRRQAKAEWDQLEQDARLERISNDTYWYRRSMWAEQYRGVITMKTDCCGYAVPDFDGIE